MGKARPKVSTRDGAGDGASELPQTAPAAKADHPLLTFGINPPCKKHMAIAKAIQVGMDIAPLSIFSEPPVKARSKPTAKPPDAKDSSNKEVDQFLDMLADEMATKDSGNGQDSYKDKKPSIIEQFANEPTAQPNCPTPQAISTQPLGSPTATCSPIARLPTVVSDSVVLPLTADVAIPKKPRWRKVQRDKEWLKTHSQDYVPRTQNGNIEYSLTIIDNPVRQPECDAATAKQWDTIIKEAKEADKVPTAVKMAKFYRLGSAIGSPYLKDGLHGIPRFKKDYKRELREKELDTMLKGYPVPLRDYTLPDHWKKTLFKYEMALQGKESPKGFNEVKPNISVVEESKKVQCQSPEKADHDPGVQPPQARHAHTYIAPWSADENLNDSEWRRGEGIVPINRNYNQTIEGPKSAEGKPSELSPENYACQDHDLPLIQYLTAKGVVNLQENKDSFTPTVRTNSLALKWMGKTDQTLRIVSDGNQILCVSFQHITAIKYHIKPDKLWISYSQGLSGDTEQILLDVSPSHQSRWLTVKHCCYSLVKGQKKTCDAGSDEFFAKKTKEFLKRHKKINLTPQHAGRSMSNRNLISQQRPAQLLAQKSSSKISATKRPNLKEAVAIGSATKVSTPAVPDRPQGQESRDSTPSKPPKAKENIKCRDKLQKTPKSESLCSISSEKQQEEKEQHGMKEEIGRNGSTTSISNGLFYAKISEGPNTPVRLNDLVVRKRTGDQVKERGERDRWDIFDGPWRVVEFDTPSKIYACDVRDSSTNNDARTSSRAQWERMLSTKVILNFPPDSEIKSRKVEISQLLPVTDIKSITSREIHATEIHAANFTISESLEFKRAQMALESILHPEKIDVDTLANDESVIGGTEVEDTLRFVEVEESIFVAVAEMSFQSADGGETYELEKLRKKRLRLYNMEHPNVEGVDIEACRNDPWFQRLKIVHPELITNHVVVAEYKVHWAGWPDEDDNWSIGPGNIPTQFIDDFNNYSDPLRHDPINKPLSKQDLVYSHDLLRLKEQDRKRKRSSTTSAGHTRGRAIPCIRKPHGEGSSGEGITRARRFENKDTLAGSGKTEPHGNLKNNEAKAIQDFSQGPRGQNESKELRKDAGIAAPRNKRIRGGSTKLSREKDLGFIDSEEEVDNLGFDESSKDQHRDL